MLSKSGIGKKVMAIGTSLCVLLGGAVGFAQEEAEPSVLENVVASLSAAESMTIDAQYAIRQNGEDMITGDAMYQTGGERQYASATAAPSDGESMDMEWTMIDGAHTLRIGDDFYFIPAGESEDEADAETGATEQTEDAAEADDESTEKTTMDYLGTVLGQLFGSVSDSIAVSDTGLALHMSGDEVPAVLNLAVSAASGLMPETTEAETDSEINSDILHGTRGEVAEPETEAPRMTLGTNLYIDRIDLDVAVEGDVLTGIQCSIMLIGKDAQGERLETEFAAVLRLIDIDATTPATVDLTGIEMNPLEASDAGLLKHIM